VLQSLAENARANKGIMPSLIAFLSEMEMHCQMPELSRAEVMLLFPGDEVAGSMCPDMYALFKTCMEEAHEDGTSITPNSCRYLRKKEPFFQAKLPLRRVLF
jgi:hypothetical protein